ncbi:immunity protein Imm33 domain-containing protein [Fictibacillus gelatini]|uniref:immunity protein Imm33 domain-containing protein n=1 Tax=Fictibacillus gelatini TaxID=225985 RepID=UPI0003F6431B|nr:hypothetical protein [Fictibacillus gelatini]
MKKFIRTIENKNIIIQAEGQLDFQVNHLFNILSKVDKSKLIDGFSLQIGWSVFFLTQKEDGYHVAAPDFAKNPFQDMTEDLTIPLWIQFKQIHFLQKLNLHGETVKFSDKIIAARKALQYDNLFLQRSSGCEKGDSGWYIGPVDYEVETEELEAFYAYQLLKWRPALIQVLALPFEYMVVFEKDEIKAVLDDQDIDIWN